MKSKIFGKVNLGYTLTEIVIVMLVIAVVVAVSLKITKAKFDSVIKYTYYSAYDILSSVTGEMITNSDLTEQYGDYEAKLSPHELNKYSISKAEFKDKLFYSLKEFFMQPAYANSCPGVDIPDIACVYEVGYTCLSKGTPEFEEWDPNGDYDPSCWGGAKKACSDVGMSLASKATLQELAAKKDEYPGLFQDNYWASEELNAYKAYVTIFTSGITTTYSKSIQYPALCVMSNCPDGEIFDADLGQCRIAQTAEDCTATQVYDKDKQMCREKNITIPQAGNDFCEAFAGMTNTITTNCTGQNTTNVKSALESGDFSELEPDIVLRNGMRLYNLKNPAVLIKKLEGNESVAMLSKSEIKISLIEKMYMVWNNFALKISYLIHNLLEQPAYAICASMHSTDGSCPGYWCEASEHKEGTGCFRCCTPKPSTGVTPVEPECTPPSCSSGYVLDTTLGECGQCVKDTSCTPPTCDEGYELDTTKGECGECTEIKDTDDKDSPEITVPTLDGLNEKGYIVYVDIDGERGDSILYEDVYPFYITFSGLVIPAFERGKEAGGNSKAHLAVSVKYDTYDSTRKINWMTPKSTDFQHAACMSNYVTATNYCTGVVDDDLASKQSTCSNKESDCRIVPNKPLKF